MVLSELTNKELKGILRENHVRNYSKLNKKGLLKKVNQLIKAQNGGGKKNGKGKNKKYTLKELIGGTPLGIGPNGNPIYPPPARNAPGGPDDPKLKKKLNEVPNPQPTPQGTNTASQGALPPATATPANVTNSTLTKPKSTSNQQSFRQPPTVNETSQIPPASIESTNISGASAPPLESDPSTGPPRISTGNKYLNAYYNPKDPKNVRLVNPEFGSNPPNKVTNNNQNNANKNNPKDECGACSIQ
jgi:hypothetical protein